MQWRPVPGHPAYEISERGRVRKADTGYAVQIKGNAVALWTDGVGVRCRVPALVAAAFAPCLPSGPEHEKATGPRCEQEKEASTPIQGRLGAARHSGCPWALARIEGTAIGADPVLGF
jgi:hypothetical protein